MFYSFRSFIAMVILSVGVHLLIVTIMLTPKSEFEEEEEFTHLKVKLGVGKTVKISEVKEQKGSKKTIVPIKNSNSEYNRKIVQFFNQEAEKQEKKDNEVSLAKLEEVGKKKLSNSDKKDSAEIVEKEEKPEKKDKAKTKEIKTIVEKVSKGYIVEQNVVPEKPFSAPVPKRKKVELASIDGVKIGNSLSEEAEKSFKYTKMLPLWLKKFKQYPEQARLLGLTGKGRVQITINRSGKVLLARIDKSTGHKILDRALMQMVRDGDPVLPVPPDLLPEKRTLSYKMWFKFIEGEQ